MKKRKKGFTLLELLIVVLIVGILVAVSLPQYMKAVERTRMMEAVMLLANIAQAQERKFIQMNRYATEFTGLDLKYEGASGVTFHTHERPVNNQQSEQPGNTNNNSVTLTGSGFEVSLSGISLNEGIATARRYSHNGPLQYQYVLARHYVSPDTSCTGTNENGASLCADFCGLNSLEVDMPCCNTGQEGDCVSPSN
ncbi:MAG: prepilin-type N-terminal cleavage/methylation domain-containing protein [Elusimicrobiaceae bacterium]|nr:prepilin-type N-terminal cleavage/methylation domain-containing protein [Elusimicrobiaceae bacterium]